MSDVTVLYYGTYCKSCTLCDYYVPNTKLYAWGGKRIVEDMC